MNEATFTVPQRNAIAKMLEQRDWGDCLFRRAKKKYEETRSSRRQAIIEEIVKENEKTGKLLGEIRSFRARLAIAEDDLRRAGYEFEGDEIDLVGARSRVRTIVERRLDEELGTEDEVSKKFDRATLRIWMVPTADEAYKVVEELQIVQ